MMLREKELEEQDFAEWNRTVHGFMRLWDIAEVLGLTPCLTKHMEELPCSDMAACLAEKGNCRETYLQLFVLSLRALLTFEAKGVGLRTEPVWEDQLLSMLDIAFVREGSPILKLLTDRAESPDVLLSSVMRAGRR
jgi:hypothetical protein